MSGLDPIVVEVVRHGLQAVAEEMGAALARTAHSVNIRDRKDFSCGVFATDGRLVAQAEHIPVHLGLLAGIVERACAEMRSDIPPGTILVFNDPWLTGSHLPDIVAVTPVDHNGRRVGYVANMAHQVDVGGHAPGSLSLGATTIFHEGLRIPPLTLAKNGEIDRNILRLFRINSRTPDEVVGDLLAQAAAVSTGSRRLAELIDRIGWDRYAAAAAALIHATARRLASRIEELPQVAASFADVLEWDAENGPGELAIEATVTVADDRLIVDFAGTADQIAGPLNATRPLTLSCVLYVVKAMLDPDIPSNAGLLDRIELRTEPGTLVDARFPAAVGLCTSIASQRFCDVLIGAFNRLAPHRAMAASTGSMNALIVGGVDPRTDRQFSYVETYGGGQGALADLDGGDGVQCHMTNTANSPVEMIERAYPITVLRYGLLPGTGGTGRCRGGDGMTRELRLDVPATVTLHLDRTRNTPWGIEGGGPGGCSSAVAVTKDGARELPAKCTLDLPTGTIVRLRTAGGGGYGTPPEHVYGDAAPKAADSPARA